MFCSNCGKRVPENSRFCPGCGAPVHIGYDTGRNMPGRTPHKKKRSKKPLIVLLCAAIGAVAFFLIAPAYIPFFMPDDEINQKTYEIYDKFDLGLADVSVPFYNEEGYVEEDNIPLLFDTVEEQVQKGISEGIITSYSREDENNCICIEYKSGITEIYTPQMKDVLEGKGESYITTIEPTSNHFSTYAYSLLTMLGDNIVNFLDIADLPYTGPVWPAFNAFMVTDAYPDQYNYTYAKELMDEFYQISHPVADSLFGNIMNSYDHGAIMAENVTVDNLKKLNKSKIVIWEGHGGYNRNYHSYLVTGQPKLPTDFNKYTDDLESKRLLVTNRELSLEYIAGVVDGDGLFCHYIVTDKFFDKYLGEMDDTLVFLGACESLRDDTLAKSFIRHGADVVYGYTRTVSMMFEMNTRTYVFYALANGASAQEAKDYSRSVWGQEDPDSYHAQLEAVYSDPSMGERYYLDGIRGEESVIKIATAEELDQVRENLSGNYELVADIDLSGYSWVPIGDAQNPFTGTFQGGGHSIAGLKIEVSTGENEDAGLFGCVSGGEVSRVHLRNAQINVSVSVGADADYHFANAGGICGQLINRGSVRQCSVKGTIASAGAGNTFARTGGIAGGVSGNCVIADCSVDAVITAEAEQTNSMAGGISAWLESSTIDNCLVYGQLKVSNQRSYVYAGGINASGGDSGVSRCVVLLDRIDASGTTEFSHPVSPFSELFRNRASENLAAQCTSTEDVVHERDFKKNHFISQSDGRSKQTYDELLWDFDTIWTWTNDGPVLR